MEKKLTKLEEEIMQIVWEKGACMTGDVIKELHRRSGKKPAHSTVSTMLRILVKKEVLTFEAIGSHARVYKPRLQREDFLRQKIHHIVRDYFGSSTNKLVSFLAGDKELSDEKLARLAAMLEEE